MNRDNETMEITKIDYIAIEVYWIYDLEKEHREIKDDSGFLKPLMEAWVRMYNGDKSLMKDAYWKIIEKYNLKRLLDYYHGSPKEGAYEEEEHGKAALD